MRHAKLTEKLRDILKKGSTYKEIYEVRLKMSSGFNYSFVERDFASETPKEGSFVA
jgi:hypothetical protein